MRKLNMIRYTTNHVFEHLLFGDCCIYNEYIASGGGPGDPTKKHCSFQGGPRTRAQHNEGPSKKGLGTRDLKRQEKQAKLEL